MWIAWYMHGEGESIVAAFSAAAGGAARIRQMRFFTQVDRPGVFLPDLSRECAFVRACGHGGPDRVLVPHDPSSRTRRARVMILKKDPHTPADAWVQPRHRSYCTSRTYRRWLGWLIEALLWWCKNSPALSTVPSFTRTTAVLNGSVIDPPVLLPFL